ncbi:MAG: hypothetical protein ACXADS_16225 [Candidatus Thorarchaeota archaeon]|jgi:hypothetical protein
MTQDDKRFVNDKLDYIEIRLPLIPTLKPHLKEIEGIIKKARVGDINPKIERPFAWMRNYLWGADRPICDEATRDIGRKDQELLGILRGLLGKDYEPTLDKTGIVRDMDPLNPKARCWNTGKYKQIYYKANKKIPGRTEENVCQCDACKRARSIMAEEIGKYRKELEEKKKKEQRAKEKRDRIVRSRGDVY